MKSNIPQVLFSASFFLVLVLSGIGQQPIKFGKDRSEEALVQFKHRILENPYDSYGSLVNAGNAWVENINDLSLQWSIDLPASGGKSGVGSDGAYIYVTSWFNPTIEQYDLEGNLIDSFEIDGIEYICGLAYDGNHFFATDATNQVYEIDLDSQEMLSTITAPMPVRGIAYDEDLELFYGVDLLSPIFSFDYLGNLIEEYDPGNTQFLYGLGYDNVSEGGPYLYGFSQENSATIIQYSLPECTQTDLYFNVLEDLNLSEGVAGGLSVVKDLVPGTASLVGLIQSEVVFGYELGLLESYENDVAVLSIEEPESSLSLSENEAVSVLIKNYGSIQQSDFPVTLYLDGIEIATETFPETIDPGATAIYTFVQTVNLNAPGQSFLVEVCSDLESDEFAGNDCNSKTVTYLEANYCEPTSNCNLGDGFEDFILGDIENLGTGCSDNGYGDFTELSTVLEVSSVQTVTFACSYGNQYVSLWIDLDQDSQFEPEELMIEDFEAFMNGETYSVDFEIPQEALSGETRLRIRSNWLNSSAYPCDDFIWGETEDYTVVIENNPLQNNVGVVSLSLPSFTQPAAITPLAVVKNFGTETQSFPVQITIGEYSSVAVVESLDPGALVEVEFEVWDAGVGTYDVLACTQLEGDENPDNDCEETQVIIVDAITAYGYVNYDPGNVFEEGWVAFDVSDPGQLFQLSSSPLYAPLVGATWVDSIIYAVAYAGEVYSFDPQTSTQTLLFEDTPLFGLAFDGTTFFGNSAFELFTVDIVAGTLSLVGAFENPDLGGIVSIAADGDGNLFGVDLGNDVLYAIDKETAVVETIGPLGGNFITILDIAFDKNTNTLYFAGQTYGGESGLYILDTQSGEAVLTAPLQNNVHISALAIPSSNALLLAPENLQASVNGSDVELAWQEPFTGNPDIYNVYRDSTLIASTPDTFFVNENLDYGIYDYQISALYAEGESDWTEPLQVSIGNPSIQIDPQSISAVLETGETASYGMLVKNNGTIDLIYSLVSYYSTSGKTSGAVNYGFDKEYYKEQAAERFGKDWEFILENYSTPLLAPDGVLDYCIPTSNCYFGDGINSFELAEISNLNSGCSPSGYGDFTTLTATLTAGMTYTISLSSSYFNNFANVWIDLDQDNVFSEEERLVTDLPLETAGEVYNIEITLPLDAMNGETRLRVMGSWLYSNQDPCLNTTFGETEDYTVVIGGNVPWISFENPQGTIEPGDSTVIELSLDASTLDPMVYTANLVFTTNDTLAPVLEVPVSLTVLEQSLSNFEPVWETPFNPMSIFVVGAVVDSMDLQLGDEVGIFDLDPGSGELICVGAGVVLEPLNGVNVLEVIVSMDDSSNPEGANGFTPGNELIFKIWTQELGEVEDVVADFPNPGFDEVFTPLGTAFVTLSGEALTGQDMIFQPGWNLVSSSVEPLNTNMMTFFQPLIEMEVLEKVIDQDGGNIMYIPYPEPTGRWINSIGTMSNSEGYYVKVNDNVEVEMLGLPVQLPHTMNLNAGWNIMGYPAVLPQDALDVVQPLIDAGQLYKVLDDAGGLIQYIPFPEPNGLWINTIGSFESGEGYYLKTTSETSLTLTDGSEALTSKPGSKAVTSFFEPAYQNNPYMPMHIILLTDGWLDPGDEVGVFDGELCVGASVYDPANSDISISVASMDDPDTELVDGFIQDNPIVLKIYKAGVLHEDIEIQYLEGNETFAALDTYMGLLLGGLTGTGNKQTPSIAVNVVPNPVDDRAVVVMDLLAESLVSLCLKDLNGKSVEQYQPQSLPAGRTSLPLELGSHRPGIYLLEVKIVGSMGGIQYLKVVVQ